MNNNKIRLLKQIHDIGKIIQYPVIQVDNCPLLFLTCEITFNKK